MALEINILSYDADDTAEAGTTLTNITMTSHGLETGDYIVNTTRSAGADRGSRKVTKVDNDNLTVDEITDQASGDTIKKYKFVDRANLLRAGSLTIVETSENDGTASFTLHTTSSYIPRVGQEVVIKDGSDKNFGGIITSANRRATSEKGDSLFIDVQADGYHIIPARRTVQANHTNKTAGEIVQYWIDNALNQEGISAGTIDDGCTFNEFIDSVMSVKEIFDKCANNSGFKWYIDKDKTLHFVQDDASITDSSNNLLDSGGFSDFRDLNYQENLDEYVNKVFVVGGTNDYGYVIFVSQEDETESTNRQAIEAGSGVYGMVYEDSSIETATYNTAETGTTTTNITITGHGLSVGDYIYNFTQGVGRNVTAVVDADNVTVDAITDQADGDEIIIYTDANALISNALKKRGIIPARISFKSSTSFTAGQRLRVDLADYGIDDSYYLIDRVEHFDLNGQVLHRRVEAIARKTGNFSTQKKEGAREYFAQIISKAKGQSGVDLKIDSNSSNSEVSISSIANESAYTSFSAEQALDGIDVDFKYNTAVAFMANISVTPSAAMSLTVKARVAETAEVTRTYEFESTNKDTIDFTGCIKGIDVGTKTVDITVTPSTGSGTIAVDEYNLTLIISTETPKKIEPIPDYQPWTSYPDSPVLTEDYPYQFIREKSSGTVILLVSDTPFEHYYSAIYNESDNIAPAYVLNGDTWDSAGSVNPGNAVIIGTYYVTQSNFDIYDRDGSIYFAKTT